MSLLLSSCAGQQLEGRVGGIQTRLQDAIKYGSKTIGCAPKETALAEANVKFAEEALKMGEYYRGKEHVILADKYTEIAELKTDKVRCKPPDIVTPGKEPTDEDKDGDGYLDPVDECPEDPEDFDGYEDEDGCHDPDNDGDGVLDASEFDESTRLWINLDTKDDVDCRMDPEDPDGFEDEDGCPDPDNDQDGVLDTDDPCPNDPEDFDQWQDEDGCPEDDNDGDTILDADDQCPTPPGPTQEEIDSVKEDFDGEQDEDGCPDLKVKLDPCAIKLDDKVYFEFNKWNVDPKSYSLLDDVVQVMNQNPDITIEVGGHTDSKGSNKYNERLSQKRVDSVREYIVGKGIKGTRITAKGYGESRPIDTNRTAEGRANNRRVEFLRTDNPECLNK